MIVIRQIKIASSGNRTRAARWQASILPLNQRCSHITYSLKYNIVFNLMKLNLKRTVSFKGSIAHIYQNPPRKVHFNFLCSAMIFFRGSLYFPANRIWTKFSWSVRTSATCFRLRWSFSVETNSLPDSPSQIPDLSNLWKKKFRSKSSEKMEWKFLRYYFFNFLI